MSKITVNSTSFEVADTPVHENFWDQVSKNKWEPETFEILDRFVNSQSTYLDIGAWIGPTALYASGLAKEVHAVEPNPSVFQELSQNIKISGRENLIPYHLAISNETKKFRLGNKSNEHDSMSSLLLSESKYSWEVQGKTFADFLNDIGNPKVDFIKMDIEGAEEFVLPSMKDYLRKEKPSLLLSLHFPLYSNRSETLSQIADALSSYTYIYSEDLKPISLLPYLKKRLFLDKILMKKTFLSVLATDKAAV